MLKIKTIALGLFLSATFAVSGALAQCGTQAPANQFCGGGASGGLAGWRPVPAGGLAAIAGGTVLGNPTAALAAPVATSSPVLGIPGTSQGSIGLAGATSGTVTIRGVAAAGTYNFNLPTSAGSAGQILQSGGGGTAAMTFSTATYPSSTVINQLLFSSANNVVAGIAAVNGGLLNASSSGVPGMTVAPVIGVPGSAAGTLGLAGSTSGTAVIAAQAAAGTATLTLPNTSGTFAVNATSPLVLSPTTGGLTCPTCVTSSGGGAITGTAPIVVSAAGVVSVTSSALTKTDDTNVTLTLGGTPASALLQPVSLTLGWSGQLALARGGSNASLTASNGGIVWSNATQMQILAGTATAGQMLRSGASATPSWSTAVYPASTAAGTVMASATANTLAATSQPVLGVNGSVGGQFTLNGATSGSSTLRVAAAAGTGTVFQLPPDNGTVNWLLKTDGSGNTSWVAPSGVGTVTSVAAGTGISASPSPITGSGTISLAAIATNKMLANTSGSSAAPVAVDIPTYNNSVFTSGGTFTTPAKSTTSTVYHYRVQGAGGGAGGINSSGGSAASTSGGACGAYAEGWFTGVAASTGITITVGSAGASGANTGGAGGSGGSSSIGAPVSVTANGGTGSNGVTTVGARATPSNGGSIVGSPQISITGGTGFLGIGSTDTGIRVGGAGCSSPMGAGGQQSAVDANGSAGTGYGSGGSGTTNSTAAGGAGSPGLVAIDYAL